MPEAAKNPEIHEVGKLFFPHQAAGEVTKRNLAIAKAQPPPRFMETTSNLDSSGPIGACSSTTSNSSIFNHSSIRICMSCNAMNDSRYCFQNRCMNLWPYSTSVAKVRQRRSAMTLLLSAKVRPLTQLTTSAMPKTSDIARAVKILAQAPQTSPLACRYFQSLQVPLSTRYRKPFFSHCKRLNGCRRDSASSTVSDIRNWPRKERWSSV